MANTRELLLLRHQDLRVEVAALFASLGKDRSLSAAFFSNPAMVLRAKLPSLAAVGMTAEQDQLANRMLFSVLTNDEFKAFLKDFQKRKSSAVAKLVKDPSDVEAAAQLDENALKSEFAEAILKFGDKELVANLLGTSAALGPGTGMGWFAVYVVLIVVVAAVHALVMLGTTHDVAPTFGKIPISAAEIRRISEQLVAAARTARQQGGLV